MYESTSPNPSITSHPSKKKKIPIHIQPTMQPYEIALFALLSITLAAVLLWTLWTILARSPPDDIYITSNTPEEGRPWMPVRSGSD
jgi:hypothetical protein